MKLLIPLLLILVLSGCADTGALNLGSTVIDGEQATAITGQIKDASVQKEAIYFQAREKRDKAYKAMYKESGFNVKFEFVEVAPGIKVQVMKEVSFKEFDQPMPAGPSEHPVWKTVDNVVDKGTNVFLWWTGIKELAGVLKGAQDVAQPKYYGNYNPQTAEPYIIEVEPFIVE